MNDRMNTELFLFCQRQKASYPDIICYNIKFRYNFVLKITLKAIYSDYSWQYLNFLAIEFFIWKSSAEIFLVLNLIIPLLQYFLLSDGLVRQIIFQHFFREHLFFVSKLVRLSESITSIEKTIFFYLNDIRFVTFPSY